MERTAILAVAALSLASCTTTQTAQIDAAIQKNLPQACRSLDTAYIGFSAIAAAGKIKPSSVAKVEAVYAGTRGICANPETTTTAEALVKAAQAYLVISTALKQAQ